MREWVLRGALAAYVLGALVGLVDLAGLRRRWARWAAAILAVGWVLQGIHLAAEIYDRGALPAQTLQDALPFLAFLAVGLYLVLRPFSGGLEVLGAFVAPVAVILFLLGLAIPGQAGEGDPRLHSLWFPFHVGLAFLGDAFLVLGFAAAVAYLLQERQVKEKRPGAIWQRLPPLEVLDAMNAFCLRAGFPLLTLGMLSGAFWALEMRPVWWKLESKETGSLLAWLLFAVLLYGRVSLGWRGRRAALGAILGFGVLAFAFVGVTLLVGGHGFV